jgi:hypothetical protein
VAGSEGFPGVLHAASAPQASEPAATQPDAADGTLSDAAHVVPEAALTEADEPDLTLPPPDLAAILLACFGAHAMQTPPPTVAADQREPSCADPDEQPRIPNPLAAPVEGVGSSGGMAGKEAPRGFAAVPPAEQSVPNLGPVAPPAGEVTPAVPAAPTTIPRTPQADTAVPRETPSGILASVVESLTRQATAPEDAQADGPPEPPERTAVALAALAPAAGVSNTLGVLAPATSLSNTLGTLVPDDGAAGDADPRRDIPDRMPPRAGQLADSKSPSPPRNAPAVTWVGHPTDARAESAPPESFSGVPSRQPDAAPVEAAGRDAPDAATQTPYRGGEAHEAAVAARPDVPSAWRGPVEAVRTSLTQHGVDRVTHAVRTSLAHGGMEVRLRLHPDSLGEVRVAVRWEGGVLSARLEAATPAARDALEGGSEALRASLQEQGIPLDRLSIAVRTDVQSHSQGRGASSHAESQPEQAATLPRPERPEEAPTGRAAAADGRLDIRI